MRAPSSRTVAASPSATILLEGSPLEGSPYDTVDRVRVSSLDDLVVRGRLTAVSDDGSRFEWMRGY